MIVEFNAKNFDSQGYAYSQQGLINKAAEAHWNLRKCQTENSKDPKNRTRILAAEAQKHEVDGKIESYTKKLAPEVRKIFISKLNTAINNKISAETNPALKYFSIFHRQVLRQAGNAPVMSAVPR